MDCATLRCAAFAEAKAVDWAPPLKEAVAPMTIMLPSPFSVIEGITSWAQATRPRALVAQEDCMPSKEVSIIDAHSPAPAL